MKNRKHSASLTFLLAVAILFPASAAGQMAETAKKGTRTIYLVRHGQYDHADKRDEFTGRELVPLGIAQARLLAARLRAMPVRFSSLTSSTMTRARQTAQVIGREFPGVYKLIVQAEGSKTPWLPARELFGMGYTQIAYPSYLLNRIIAGVERPVPHEGEACRVSASIGAVLSCACPGATSERLHAKADAALYAAKRAGRGRATLARVQKDEAP